jgi:di/tricarboxylate transporter
LVLKLFFYSVRIDLVGTTPNIILKGYYEQNIPEAKLDFLKYMLYALPVSIILEFLAWAWLAFLWLPKGYCNLLTYFSIT